MRICVVGGGGAIGGYLSVKLALAGNDVTVIARGKTLDAIQRSGLTLSTNEVPEGYTVRITAVEYGSQVEKEQDLVILAVKAQQLTVELLESLPLSAHTVIIPMQNGVPFWYFYQHGGQYAGRHVESVDPAGKLLKTIDGRRIVGCVVYPAAVTVSPGVIRLVEGVRFPIGELDGTNSERCRQISQVFVDAGFKAPVLENIRDEIWLKLWGNLSFNPISALTHGTLAGITQFPLTRQLAYDMMAEAQKVAERFGVKFRVTIEKRIEGAEKIGEHKTSMLQDVEAGRSLEVDALIGSVIELSAWVSVDTPYLKTVYALSSLLNRSLQIRQSGLAFPDEYKNQ